MITKKPKMISLDIEITKRLENESNSSELINNLLQKHFNSKGHFTLEEIKGEIKSLELTILEQKTRVNKLKMMEKDLILEEKAKKNTPEAKLLAKYGNSQAVQDLIATIQNKNA